MTTTVFRLTASVVQQPFTEGSDVEDIGLGHFTTLDAALLWIRGTKEGFEIDELVERLLGYEAKEYALDVGPMDYRDSVGISPKGEVVGRVMPDEDDAPWQGRDPSTFRWRRADIIACVCAGQYRVGIVLETPPTIEWADAHPNAKLTASDDVYSVKFRDDDHHHPREWQMFEPLTEASDDLLAELKSRLA